MSVVGRSGVNIIHYSIIYFFHVTCLLFILLRPTHQNYLTVDRFYVCDILFSPLLPDPVAYIRLNNNNAAIRFRAC